jgi:3-deoxy-D-manno-octulosonic-acid transferase
MILYSLASRLVHGLAKSYVVATGKSDDPMWEGRLLKELPDGPVDIWIHAASAGEAKVAAVLVDYLLKQNSGLRVHITVMTRAGFEAAQNTIGNRAGVSYYPLDFSPLVGQLIDSLRPRIIAVTETEIWPHMVQIAADRGIPLTLINGRMSARSFGRYRKTKRMMRRLLARYTRFFLRTEEDRNRFAAFSVPLERMVVTGDMKFDAPLPARSVSARARMRSTLGLSESERLLVAGSTRPGEEEQLTDVFRAVQRRDPSWRLVIAPRHIERTSQIGDLISQAGLNWSSFSSGGKCTDRNIVVIDRMGILMQLYGAADIAFVGGTLVDIGGHNILEPVWAGAPVVFGPFIANVTEAARYIEEHNFGFGVSSIVELERVLEEVADGRGRFDIKTEEDLETSATAEVGQYLLRLLKDLGTGHLPGAGVSHET